MTPAILLSIISTVLGGTNIISVILLSSEKRKRNSEASITEAKALNEIRGQYAQFVIDHKNEHNLLREEHIALRKEFKEWKNKCSNCKNN